MAYVIVASIISVVVSLIYLGYVWISFRQVKNNRKTEQSDISSESSEWESESWFSWKAFISIILSSVILFFLGKSAQFWNFVPFIAIGTAIAVIFALAIDIRKKA
ncbi:hypothetical protein [Cohnella sp. WQ 127256]|uniref:hypothetical protein n=1 Tax=Cohnella sp. WQ 127256 TaxID=2938790 RepID=UPI002119285D|nr:hypothetical protein [Cohnella sp. WQ 127256]